MVEHQLQVGKGPAGVRVGNQVDIILVPLRDGSEDATELDLLIGREFAPADHDQAVTSIELTERFLFCLAELDFAIQCDFQPEWRAWDGVGFECRAHRFASRHGSPRKDIKLRSRQRLYRHDQGVCRK